MANNTPETPRNIPAGAPAKTPPDTLLKNFRATLDARWTEFDSAAQQEEPLPGTRTFDTNYTNAKGAFDNAKAMLLTIQNDEDLKKSPQILEKVNSTLAILTQYLASIKPEEKSKAHNVILAKTAADLAQFKANITGTETDKNEAKVAAAAEKAIPRVAVAATAGGARLLASAEAKTAIGEITTELTGELKKELGPWGMIFQGVKGLPVKEVATQVKDLAKEYHDKKWAEDPFDKLFAMIQLFFLKMQIGRSGIDLSKDMTPEEMKLAGIKGNESITGDTSPNQDRTGKVEKIQETSKNILYNGSYTGLIAFHQTFLSGITQEKDPTKNKERVQRVYQYDSMYNLPYEKAKTLYSTYKSNPDDKKILSELSIDDKSQISPRDIVAALALISEEKLMSTKAIEKKIGDKKNPTVGDVLTLSHGDWSIAADFEKIDPTLSADTGKVFSQIFGNIGARFKIAKEGDVWKFGNSETQFQAEKMGMTPSILGEIMSSTININTIQESEIDKLTGGSETKVFLRKLITFWKSVRGPLAEHFSFGQQAEYASFYNSASIRPESLLKLYLVTGGDTNLTSMASLRKMGVYAIIRESFFDGTPDNKDKGATLFDKSIISIATKWALSPTDLDKYIPKDVQEAMGNISSTVAGNVIDSTWGAASRAWSALPDGWKVGVGVSATFGIMILWRLRGLKWAGIGAAVGAAGTASLFAGAVYAGLSESDKKKYPKEDIERGAKAGIETMYQKTE